MYFASSGLCGAVALWLLLLVGAVGVVRRSCLLLLLLVGSVGVGWSALPCVSVVGWYRRTIPPSRLCRATSLYTREAWVGCVGVTCVSVVGWFRRGGMVGVTLRFCCWLVPSEPHPPQAVPLPLGKGKAWCGAVPVVGDDAHIVPMCVAVGRRVDEGIRLCGGGWCGDLFEKYCRGCGLGGLL